MDETDAQWLGTPGSPHPGSQRIARSRSRVISTSKPKYASTRKALIALGLGIALCLAAVALNVIVSHA